MSLLELTPQARQYLERQQSKQNTSVLRHRWGLLEEKSEPIWVNAKIDMGILDGTKSLTANKGVTWDQNKTNIESSRLIVSAYSETSFGSARMKIYMNGQEVIDKFWDFNGSHVENVDVTSLLQNGSNGFMVTYEKNPIITVEAHLTVTVTLQYTFSGEDPGVGDDWIDWIKKNPLIVAGGLGIGIITLILVRR